MLESRLILLVLGGFLLTWGISLAARAAADRWVKRPRRPEVRRLGVRLACVAIPLGTLVAVLGVLLDWLWTGRPLGHDVGGAATLLSGFVLVVGAGVGIAGWWFDRSRGRERCPSCWFDLGPMARKGTDGELAEMMCTECGTQVSRWKDLYRTRREWRLVWCAACALPLSYLVIAGPRVYAGGIRGLIPTTVLIAWMERLPIEWTVDGRSPGTLSARLNSMNAWEWQRAWFYRRLDQFVRTEPTLATKRIVNGMMYWGIGWGWALSPELILEGLRSSDAGDVAFVRSQLVQIASAFRWEVEPDALAGREEDVMAIWEDPQASEYRWWLLAHCGEGVKRWWPEIERHVRSTPAGDIKLQHHQLVAVAAIAARHDGARRTLEWCLNGPTGFIDDDVLAVLRDRGHVELAIKLEERRKLHTDLERITPGREESLLKTAREVAGYGPCMRSYVLITGIMQDSRLVWSAEQKRELDALRERVRFRVLEE